MVEMGVTLVFQLVNTILLILIFWVIFKIIKRILYIERKASIHGTYRSKGGTPDRTTSLTINEDTSVYFHFNKDNSVIQTGYFEKNDEKNDIHVLFKNNTESIYGKMIQSDHKIYLIDRNLNILTFKKISQALRICGQQDNGTDG